MLASLGPMLSAHSIDRAPIRDIVKAVATDDLPLFYSAFERLHRDRLWPDALRALARKRVRPSPRMQLEFVDIYSTFGIGVGRELISDRDAVSALRLLLPPYDGPDMQLWRGDCAHNHRLGAYGLSWTPDRRVAIGHIKCAWQAMPGGAVLLLADVPASAIISAPCLLDDAPYLAQVEHQYIVDRRELRNVRVIERFSDEDWVAPWRRR